MAATSGSLSTVIVLVATAAAVDASSHHNCVAGGEFSPIEGDSRQQYDDGVKVVTSKAHTPKTSAAQAPSAITVRIVIEKRKGLLHLFDAAGEFFANREESALMRFLDQARGIVFVVDPFSIPRVVDEAPTTVLGNAQPARDHPETAYNVTVQRLRDYKVKLRYLAITVVKGDLLLDLPSGFGLTAGSDSDAVRTWLADKGLDNIILAAERDFSEVRYFLVSSWTGWQSTDKLTAAAPLLWLVNRQGLPISDSQFIGGIP
jgi:hypothetical protein